MTRTPDARTWKGKTVLITGVCGTIGKELLRQISRRGPERIIGLDTNESELFFLEGQKESFPGAEFFLGDVRDPDALARRSRGVDIILHTAALKHVILSERSPRDAIQTNIIGVRNVIDAAMLNGAGRVIFTSSDKAVNPTNVMGTSKLMGERLITAANAEAGVDGPVFASTRFGNVLGSRGSVVPVFKRQIAAGGPVTLTDPAMTRFIMTLEEAVSLTLESVFLARGGEIFVTKMPAARIEDLAVVMIEELAGAHGRDPEDIKIKTVGVMPGEKMYEELLNEEEARRTVELDGYYVVTPAFRSVYRSMEYDYPGMRPPALSNSYNSGAVQPLGREDLRKYLRESGVLAPEA